MFLKQSESDPSIASLHLKTFKERDFFVLIIIFAIQINDPTNDFFFYKIDALTFFTITYFVNMSLYMLFSA